VSEEGRKAGGIDDGMLRLSVGLEDPEDLWQDLRLALDCALELAEAPMARAVAGS
jgi:cystathionine beta-lyase/cystathionine gamma-synthase